MSPQRVPRWGNNMSLLQTICFFAFCKQFAFAKIQTIWNSQPAEIAQPITKLESKNQPNYYKSPRGPNEMHTRNCQCHNFRKFTGSFGREIRLRGPRYTSRTGQQLPPNLTYIHRRTTRIVPNRHRCGSKPDQHINSKETLPYTGNGNEGKPTLSTGGDSITRHQGTYETTLRCGKWHTPAQFQRYQHRGHGHNTRAALPGAWASKFHGTRHG